MVFLAAILAWLIALSISGQQHPGAQPLQHWIDRQVERFGASNRVFLIMLLGPVCLAGFIVWWIDIWVVSLALSVLVLVLAFGPGDQVDQLKRYRLYRADGDDDAAYQHGVEHLGLPEGLYESGSETMDEALKEGLAYRLFERFFVSFFWFVAFGIPGVLLVGLLRLLEPVFRANNGATVAVQFRHAVNWIPVRLLVLSMGLVGNFAHTFAIWLRRAREFEISDHAFLWSAIKAALPAEASAQRPEDLLLLLKRAQILWLVLLALFVIFS
ncbi:MAG: regulatory signaling modulator protein AmpE [Saccharospirillum sp.]